MEQLSTFIDANGEVFRVTQLTRELAETHVDWLVRVHNYIPYQQWTRETALADHDDYREFHGKWEISRIALSENGNPIGFCIGFELVPDGIHYLEPGIYMHRMSLEHEYRSRQIGAILHAEAIGKAFERGIRRIKRSQTGLIIYGQTNDVPENKKIIQFYFDAGFKVVGAKSYPDRKDVILSMTEQEFLKSRHAKLWRSRRIVL